MISESALARACRPAILGRARIIAQREGRIWQRTCSYEGRLTHLSARVDSSSGFAESYEASLTIDEAADDVFSYQCSCPAAARFSGPCKHSIALGLDFNRNAQLYDGHSQLQHVGTSVALKTYLDRMARTPRPRLNQDQNEAPGSVSLAVRLTHDNELYLGLKVVGARGAYVVRELGEFEQLVSEGSYYAYGKRLAFTHTLDAFVPSDQALVRFVCNCVRNRRSYAGNRVYGHVYATSSSSLALGKELRLSPPEVDKLMELLQGRTVAYELAAQPGRQSFTGEVAVVQEGSPHLSLELVRAGDHAFQILREGQLDVFGAAEGAYAVQDGKLYRLNERLTACLPFLQQVYCSSSPELLMTEDDARRFATVALPTLEHALPVRVVPELDALRPEPLRLSFVLGRDGASLTCDALAHYGEKTVRIFDRMQGDEASWRDALGEAEGRAAVTRYFTTARKQGLVVSRPDPDSVARILFEGVGELERLGTVRLGPDVVRLTARPKPRVSVRVSSNAGLIDVSMHADDLPAHELYELLASYRERKPYHRLSDGSFVSLEGADLTEAALLADELGLTARQLGSGHAEVPSYRAFLVDALASGTVKDASFVAAIDHFRHVDPTVYEPPAELADRLRPYQVAGFRWLSALADMGFGGILADEMGLGKSVQVISFLLARRGSGQTLVACPASLVYNWVAEFTRFAPQIDVVAVAGSAQERRQLRAGNHEVMVTSYDLLRRDIEDYAQQPLWCAVLDEAQYIKNHQTLAAHAVKTLDAQHRLALTGTPVENRLSELWSIFDFLMPGLLGSYERFRERFEQPIADGSEEAAALLRTAVEPFVLRRLKRQVLDDLPDKLEEVVTCRMGRTQRSLYAAREQALRMSLGESQENLGTERMQVLAELTRLRQLCCDPRLVYKDYDGGSCKLDAIWQLVSSAVDAHAKVLVFSQFTSFLDLIAERLTQEGIEFYTITGATPKKRRVELVDAFNSDDTPVFLVSLRAGGTGLNLVGASVVIHADPWWNVAVQDQATDRAHRIGQTRDVTVYKVIAAQSIEERILLLQEMKSDLAERFVGAGGGAPSLSALTRDDLLALLAETDA